MNCWESFYMQVLQHSLTQTTILSSQHNETRYTVRYALKHTGPARLQHQHTGEFMIK